MIDNAANQQREFKSFLKKMAYFQRQEPDRSVEMKIRHSSNSLREGDAHGG